MRRILAILPLSALAACGYATEKVNSDVSMTMLEGETAAYFQTHSGNVSIENYKQGVWGTSYQARVAGTLYNCNYFRSSMTCQKAY